MGPSSRIASTCGLLGLIVFQVVWGFHSSAEAAVAEGSLLDYTSINFQVLAFDTESVVRRDSVLNPENIARLPSGRTDVEGRLDLKLTTDPFVLSLKPRVISEWRRIQDGESRNRIDLLLNQWSATVLPIQSLAFSVGRDILTWGPSNFRSPSNPFYFDNGRSNPIRELRGIDVVKVSYAPTEALSLTLLHNFGDGQGDWQWERDEDFRARILLKADYTADVYAASVNLSKRWDGERPRLGAFAQATVTEALLVYAEAGLRQGSTGLYPEEQDNPLGWGFSARYAESDRLFYSALVGGGYTLESGYTIYLEYLNNNEGYTREEGKQYFDIAQQAADALASPSPKTPFAGQALVGALNNGLMLQGRHYLFLQFQNNPAEDGPIWQLRYSLNLLDGSGQGAGYIEWNASNRLGLFALGVVNHGSKRSEFHSLMSGSLLVGAKGYIW